MSLLDAFDQGIVFPIGADISDMVKGLEQAQAKLDEANVKFNISNKDLEIMAAGARNTGSSLESLARDATMLSVPLLAVGATSYAVSERFGDMASRLKDLSRMTGINTTDLQHMQYAAKLSGADVGVLNAALSKLTLSMDSAADKTSSAAKAFRELGVNPAGKSTKEVFDEAGEALMKMEDGSRRNRLAMELFGRSWREVLPIMETYKQKQDEINAHPTLSPQELERLEKAKQRWDDLIDRITIFTGEVLSLESELQSLTTKLASPMTYLLGWNAGDEALKGSIYENIPHFASGGVVTEPTLAMVGEAGPEAVVPVSGAAEGGGVRDIVFRDCSFTGNETQIAQRLKFLVDLEMRGKGVPSL